jgi:hypothetical protein
LPAGVTYVVQQQRERGREERVALHLAVAVLHGVAQPPHRQRTVAPRHGEVVDRIDVVAELQAG